MSIAHLLVLLTADDIRGALLRYPSSHNTLRCGQWQLSGIEQDVCCAR